MCIKHPSCFETRNPELIEITGIPAATAARIEGPNIATSGIDTINPSGFDATASSIKCDISARSKLIGRTIIQVAVGFSGSRLSGVFGLPTKLGPPIDRE